MNYSKLSQNILLAVFAFILPFIQLQAQDYQISANGTQSVMACTSGDVYAWGKNTDGALAIGNTTESIYRPTKVLMPAEAGKIQHVDGSSGAFLLAINCNGEVWIWGDNQFGQCGNSTQTGKIASIPVFLMGGEATATPTAKISGIKAISGGSSTGYAITADDRLIAWGNGADGRLGNGTSTTSNLPVYVRDKNGNILENVIMVDGGDNTCYCLVDDDGDGLGTVYSFGQVNKSMLGRSTSAINYYALPVEKEDGSVLDNIKVIAAGDVHGTAMDADNYIWIWGNNWGGSAPGNNFATMMAGGETGETFLQAKSIAGGNGFNMAVTLDGHLVTWGVNGSTDHSGGNLGNGTTTSSPTPVYVRVSSTMLLEDVATVSRGNSWGFARKADNSIWTWGSNLYGVLGIGSTAANPEVYAKELNLSDITCGLPDMKPTVALPPDFTTCIYDGWSYEISSGPNSGAAYQFTWEKDGTVIAGQTNPTLTVTEAGTYTVTIKYIGSTYPCENPDDATGSVTITALQPTFSVPTDIEYCGDNVDVYVNGTGIYDFYTAENGGSYLGTSTGSNTVSIPVSSLTEKSGDTYTLYVQEVSRAKGVVNYLDNLENTSDDIALTDAFYSDRYAAELTAYSDMVIDSVTVYFHAWVSTTTTGTLNIGLYSNATALPLSSLTKIDETGSTSYSISGNTTTYQAFEAVTVPLGFSLTGDPAGATYYLGMVSNTNVWRGLKSTATYPYADNADGNTLVIKNTYCYAATTTTPPPFYNIYFHSVAEYCNRLPITITQGCTCTEPADVTITPSSTYLCPGETTNLTTNNQADATTFDFSWYSGSGTSGTVLSAPTAGANSSLTNLAAGTYTVLVRDIAYPTSCLKTQEITIEEKDAPTVTITNSGESSYCFGETVTAPTFTFTGTAPYSFTYSDGVNTAITTTSASNTFTPPAPSAVGEYTYKVTALSDAFCSAVIGDLTSSTNIEIKTQPEITAATTSGNVCAGKPLTVSCTATNATGATYSWSGPSFTATTATATVSSAATTANSGSYTVTVSLDGCTDEATADEVTIYPIPVINTLTATPTAVCSGNDITITATVSDAGDGTIAWTNVTSSTLSATLNENVTSVTNKTITLNYESTNSCKAQAKSVAVTINPIPGTPTTSPVSYCLNSPATAVTATTTASTVNWFDSDHNALSGAPTPSTATATTITYYVSQTENGCTSGEASLVVTINNNLSPNITATKDVVCRGEEITLGLSTSYKSQEWNGGDATYVSSTIAKTPTLYTKDITANTFDVTVSVTDINECKGTATKTITINPIPTATITASPNAICNKTSTTITATPSETGGIGAWTGATKVDETSATFTAASDGSQTVSYTYTSASGCVMTTPATTSITVYSIPAKPTTANVKYCQNFASPVALTATATGTLTWFDASNTELPSAPIPSTATDGTTTYSVLQTENGCSSEKATLNVVIHKLPAPVISPATTAICEKETQQFSLNTTYASQTWTCTPTNYLNSTTIAAPTFNSAQTATADNYTISVSVTDNNSCTGTSTASITVNPIPSVTLSSLVSKCKSETTAQTVTADITPSGTTGTGTWTNATKLTEFTAEAIPSSYSTGEQTISYSFTSDKGCDATAVSTKFNVYALPVITLTPSKTAVCQGGANSATVTMETTGTATTGTFNYTSATLTSLNADGSFAPTSQTTGLHTISLEYTDVNSCKATASASVTVNARPTADVSLNPTAICDYASNISLLANINGTATSEGTFSGTGVSGKTFSPSSATAGGPYTISYNYTDATTGCSAEAATFAITVNHTNPPTTTSQSASKLDVTDQSSVPNISATGDNIQWYATNDTTQTVIATNVQYQPTYVDDGGYMKVGTYSAFATQTQNGCQSTPTEATLTITDCSVTAPTAVKYHACVGDADIAISAVSSHLSNDNIGWFSDRNTIPTSTVASLAAGSPDGTGGTFTLNLLGKTEGTYTMYASEYDGTAGTQCFSPATAVIVEVHALPNPQIDDPGNICGDDAAVEITFSPGTGSTLSGTGVSGSSWTPQYDVATTGTTTTTLTLESEATWGSGTDVTATCSNTVTRDITVTNVLAPTGTGIGTELLWSIGSIPSLPAMTIDYAKTLGATLSVKDSTNTEIATESPVAMYPNNISELGTYNYNVTQTLNGCTSAEAVSVYKIVECPTPTPAPASKEICVGDALPEIAANGTGTPSYEWIDSTNAVIATTETLDISTLTGYTSTAGTYTFQVRQDGLDAAGNSCWGGYGSATLTVHALPTIVIDEIPTLCYDGGDYEVIATINGVRSLNGTWTIDNATSGISSEGIITPTFNGEKDQTFELAYEFTNAHSCTNNAKKQFSIEFAQKPTVESYVGIISDPKTVELTAENIETSATVAWYTEANGSVSVSNDNPFATGDDATTVTATPLSYWVSQTINGCESERSEATVSIVDCPFAKPTVGDVQSCANTSLADLSASTGATVIEWKWYDASLNPITNDAATYSHGVSNATADTSVFYVSYIAFETQSGKNCESPKAKANVIVLPLPEFTFNTNNPSLLCYNQGDEQLKVSVNYHNNGVGSGSWSVDGETGAINATTGVFNSAYAQATNTYTVRYDYTDGKNCSNSATTPLTLQYVPKPTLTNHYSMTIENKDATLSATAETGATINWYNTASETTAASHSNPWTTGDKGNVVANKEYFASQTINGCESERETTTVVIVNCPVPAPTTVGAEMCNYDETPALTASLGSWTVGSRPTGSAEKFRFYDALGSLLEENETGSFTPTIDKTTASVYTYYVTEWNDNTLPVGCESQKTEVTLRVKKTPSANINASQESVCAAPEGTNPSMTATDYTGSGSYMWFEENPNYPACDALVAGTGNSFVPNATATGQNTVWLVVSENDCYSEPANKSFTIKEIPDAPQTTPSEICKGQTNIAVSATANSGAFISWYSNASHSSSTLLKTNSATYTPTVANAGTYSFYATQTVDGCQSTTQEVVYTIKDIPSIPIFTYNTYNLCSYDDAPMLTAVGENITWYLSDKTTKAIETYTESHQTTDMSIGKHTYYATQTVDGCESQQAGISFYVNAKPIMPITTNKTMCAGDEVIPTLTTNLASDSWYADELATVFIQNGLEYTPENVQAQDMNFYILREQNGCVSDTAIATLYVIQQPTFEIDSTSVVQCRHDDAVQLNAINLDIDYHTDKTIEGKVLWYFNKNTTEGDSFTPNVSEMQVGKNMIYAQYFVNREGTTCVSEQHSATYEIRDVPKAPILLPIPICLGEYLSTQKDASVPIFAHNDDVMWYSSMINNGEENHSRTITIPSSTLELLDAGYIPITIIASDPDAPTCTTILQDSIKISGIPDATIVGDSLVCEGTVNEFYFVQNPEATSTYLWNISGNNLIYTKSNDFPNTRYVDWTKQTIDTLMVTVVSEDYCIASDTMVIRVAPMPQASFTWTLPGASNVIALTDSSTQDSLWYTNAQGERVSEEIPYTMYWNYGHQGESEDIIDEEIPYRRKENAITEDHYQYGYNCPILTIVNDYGCSSSYTECIFVSITTSLYVPNAFSPSNPAEGVRTFQPKGYNLETCVISVYDKWGNLVWHSDEVENGIFVGEWDGHCNGKMMASDVYIWKMEATFLDGQSWEGFDNGNGKKTKFGSVTLIR